MTNKNGDKHKILLASKSILKSMPQFAYVFNKDNKLVMWNKNLETVLGYSKEELYEKDAYDFLEEKDKEENVEVIYKVFSEKEEQSLEQNILTKSGKKIPVIDTANYALIDGDEYLIGLAIDISQLKKTEKKLKDQIKKTNQLKDLLYAENINLRKEIIDRHEFNDIIGESKPLINVLYQIKQVAKTESTVLIQGEIGTRKQFYARAIYSNGNRNNDAFLKIDCTSFKKENIDKDFYEFIKEKFTEVEKIETGKFEIINRGTLYFDEICEIPLDYQVKLLKALRKGKFEISGYSKVIHMDIRVIASTNQNIEELVNKNLFLKDLYFYLNSFPIKIPSLRERISDIQILAEKYIKVFNSKYGKQVTKIPLKSMNNLQNYSWPGNVRELENVIERSVILSNSSLLKIDQLTETKANEKIKYLSLVDYEKQYLIKILQLTYWRIAGNKGAAKILGLHPETLRSKMRKLNIKRP